MISCATYITFRLATSISKSSTLMNFLRKKMTRIVCQGMIL